jgi:hypothetical protein
VSVFENKFQFLIRIATDKARRGDGVVAEPEKVLALCRRIEAHLVRPDSWRPVDWFVAGFDLNALIQEPTSARIKHYEEKKARLIRAQKHKLATEDKRRSLLAEMDEAYGRKVPKKEFDRALKDGNLDPVSPRTISRWRDIRNKNRPH